VLASEASKLAVINRRWVIFIKIPFKEGPES
jgi:hypothetical protein